MSITHDLALSIKKCGVSRQLVAYLAGVARTDLSDWLNGLSDLPEAKKQRLIGTVRDLEHLFDVLETTYPNLPIDKANTRGIERLLKAIRDLEPKVIAKIAEETNSSLSERLEQTLSSISGTAFGQQEPFVSPE